MLTITSLLSILLLSFHLAQDALREKPPSWPARFGLVPKPGAAFYMWTLIALGVIGMFSVILTVRDLWSFNRGAPQERRS